MNSLLWLALLSTAFACGVIAGVAIMAFRAIVKAASDAEELWRSEYDDNYPLSDYWKK